MMAACQPTRARSAASRRQRSSATPKRSPWPSPRKQLYDLVSDVTRTGEWSPICRAAWWDEGAGPRADAWFTGRNQTGDTVWETRSLVETAERPREFAWLVSGRFVRWGYQLDAVADGTALTESWQLRRAGLQMFHDKYGDGAHERIALRSSQALDGIPRTLAAIKKIAES